MVTRFYHTRDPIANLRVRVTVRKVGVGDSRDGGVAVGASWSDSFQWQEKRWPFKPLHRKKKKNSPPADAATMEADDTGGIAVHHGIALCSYVDADNYEPPHNARESPTTSLEPPPHVVAAAADYHFSRTTAVNSRAASEASSVGASNRDRVALRVHREETFRQMHFVLRIADAEDDGGGGSRNAEDLVLASLRFYPHTGLLCVTPGFSVCVVDEKDTQAAEKGPKLSTYRVVSRTSGAQFEYALDNENELWPVVSAEDQRLLRELQRQEECEERARVEEWRNKHGDAVQATETAQSKRLDKHKMEETHDEMMVLLEIVSVSGVDAPDPIRVVVDLLIADTTGDSVLSLDGWGREHLHGYAEMRLPLVAGYTDTEVALWRPMLPPQAQMEAFFLGSDPEDARRALTSAIAADATTNILTRLGAQTTSTSGRVRVRYHVIQSRPSLVQVARPPPPPLALGGLNGPGNGGVMKRSVEEILQAVKANQFSSRSGTLAPLPLPSPSVTAIIARLKDQSNRGTSPSAG